MQRAEHEQWKSTEVARLLALVETERRYYQDIFKMLPVAVALLNENWGIAAVNREFRRRFNLQHADFTKLRLPDLIPDPVLEAALEEVMQTGQSKPALTAALGTRRLRISIQRTTGWQADSQDELLLTIDDEPAAPGAPAFQPPTGIAWECDSSTLQIKHASGEHAEEWSTLEARASERVIPADRESFNDFYRNVMAHRETGTLDYRVLSPDGPIVWQRDLVRAAGGRLMGLTLDTTEEHRTQSRLVDEAKRGALERLSARLAHVANNLLMIIGGYADELGESLVEDDPRRDDLAEIVKASDRLGALTKDLTVLTRPPGFEAKEFELSPWMRDTVTRLQGALPGGIQLEASPVEAELRAATSPILAEQVLHEALRYLKPHLTAGSHLRLDAGAPSDDRLSLELAITGVELGADVRERFFEPFCGAKEGTDPPLGLAGLVRPWKSLGGTITLEGEPGEPCRLIMNCPRAAVPAEREPLATVLVVEDEPGIRSLIAKHLVRTGYRTLVAESPASALELSRAMQHPLDLLITDLMIPGMGGGQLAEQIRQLWPQSKVLLISGYTDDAALASKIENGTLPAGTRFLAKPFTAAQLMAEVRTMLGGGEDIPSTH